MGDVLNAWVEGERDCQSIRPPRVFRATTENPNTGLQLLETSSAVYSPAREPGRSYLKTNSTPTRVAVTTRRMSRELARDLAQFCDRRGQLGLWRHC